MPSLKSFLFVLVLIAVHPFLVNGQEEDWIHVFSDPMEFEKIVVDSGRIIGAGQIFGRYNVVKTLDHEGNELWGNAQYAGSGSRYTDITILSDGTVLAAGWYNGNPVVGTVPGVHAVSFDENGTVLEALGLNALKGPRGICKIALTGENEHLIAAAGKLIHFRLIGDGVTGVLNYSWTGPGAFGPDYEHLEVWEDSLAIRTSNDLDSILIYNFSGNYFGGVGHNQKISDTEMKDEEFWFVDKHFLYRMDILSLIVDTISALPEMAVGGNFGLQWVEEEAHFFLFQRYENSNSQFWYFDPELTEWQITGQLEIPDVTLRDMIVTEEGFIFTGTFPDVSGVTHSFIGKSSQPVFQPPIKNADLAVSTEFTIADTMTSFDYSWLHDFKFTQKAEVTVTNLGPEPVDQVYIQSSPYVRFASYTPSGLGYIYGIFRDTINSTILPGEQVTLEFEGQSNYEVGGTSAQFWARSFELCFEVKIPYYWSDLDLSNNKSCAEGEYEFIVEPGDLPTLLFPNPVEETLQLRGRSAKIMGWAIINSSGQELLNRQYADPVVTDEVPIPPQWHGLYWIRVETTTKTEWQSFVVR